MPLKTKQKIGRNDPCPCGSGKKHKQCCVNNSDAWREQRNAAGLLTQKMNSFATQYFANELMAAWLDFNQQDEPESLQDNPSEAEIFIPYFLFDWRPEPVSRKRAPMPGAVAQAFLLREAERLPQPERAILDQALTQPLTFYEVVRARPGEGMEVRDLLIGGEFNVTERTGSRFFQTGDITYGQVCDLPGSTTFSRLAPLRIPPQSKPAIFALRDSLRKKIAKQNRPLTVADLILHRELVRTTYLDLRDAMNRGPVLSNTDGDPFITHTLTFQTASAQAAFEGLAPLAFGFSKADLLLRAKMGADGALEEIEIPWQTKGNRIHNDWETTLLGTIQISGRSLVVEVNSEKRATRIRKEIDKRLGILATHQETSATPPDLDGKPVQPGPLDPIAAFGAFSNAAFSPELQVELQQRVENWIHQKVPALGGRTPLDAVRDPDGKELVIALLLGWEQQAARVTDPHYFQPDIDALRRLLQLPTRGPVQ